MFPQDIVLYRMNSTNSSDLVNSLQAYFKLIFDFNQNK